MRSTSRLAILCIFFGALAVQAQHDHMHMADKSMGDPNWNELVSSMDKMHMSMAGMEPSGKSDVDFVRMMIPHHQAALDMAKAELEYGKEPEIRKLAQEIFTSQQGEIESMQLWLKAQEAQK
jgi:uncharacterized protein (DUF305 family)